MAVSKRKVTKKMPSKRTKKVKVTIPSIAEQLVASRVKVKQAELDYMKFFRMFHRDRMIYSAEYKITASTDHDKHVQQQLLRDRRTEGTVVHGSVRQHIMDAIDDINNPI